MAHRTTRIGTAGSLAVGLVILAVALPSGSAGHTTSLASATEAEKSALNVPHNDALLPAHRHVTPNTGDKELDARIAAIESTLPLHVHGDEGKNAISRDVEGSARAEAADLTTPAQRTASEAYVDTERALKDPTLTTTPAYPTRTTIPADRYAMAGGCYTMQAADGRYVTRSGTSLGLAKSGAAAFYFKATRLGGYLLHTDAGDVSSNADGSVNIAGPSPQADWTVEDVRGGGFRFDIGGRMLVARASGLGFAPGGTVFDLREAKSCPTYPEADVNITGDPFAGITKIQEVRGYVDAHTHGMAFEFLGGDVHCGRPWHEYGAPYALVDCPDHSTTGGNGAILESFLSNKPSHDPVGWPTFKDWPAPHSLTHEGTYWRWLERSWRGGQRLFVNLLVENNKLCQVYPLKRNSCDDMDSIRLQAKDMFAMQDYIDAQFGGPGKGFYRIVTDPFQARHVINAGKMAVIMGIETSIPFGCTFKEVAGMDTPACSAADIDANLDAMHKLGVRQMELVNKFDNALAGVAGDGGAIGPIVNGANWLETGTFWHMEHCEPADGESHDNEQMGAPTLDAQTQDALFAAVGQLGGVVPATPVYPPAPHCNARGLTDLGAHAIKGLAQRNMLFDPDHLSVKARIAAMDLIEQLKYPGVMSSHSWSTPDTYPRIYRDGGFIAPYAGDTTGFVDKWRRHLGWADPRYYFGFGYGADINGLGAQGDARGAGVSNPVTYPFTGFGGVTVNKQQAGQRTWDINVDGVAQYGLYPDWMQDLRMVADKKNAGDGSLILDDMSRGAEAYLQMWERAYGIKADDCRNANLRVTPKQFLKRVRKQMTTKAVMRAVGQPYQRLGRVYTFCTATKARSRITALVKFDRSGKVKTIKVLLKHRKKG